MKISVITRHAPSNYGSLLQAAATQKILEKAGHDVQIIDYVRKDETGIRGVLVQLDKKKNWNRNLLKKLIYILLRYPSEKYAELRFSSMRRKYLNLTKRYAAAKELEKYASEEKARIYVTGSDQVWGGIADKSHDPAYFLCFVPESAKKTAYAASFGKTEFTPGLLAEYKKYLSRYNHITVREASAVKILEEMEIPCLGQVFDPTLLLAPEEWSMMAPSPAAKKPYVLVYQIHNNPRLNSYAKMFAKKVGLPLFRVSPSLHQIRRGGRFIYLPQPGKFIALFRDAGYIITDSFHGTAFAINFNKQFVEVLSDRKTATRNLSLLEYTGLEDRIVRKHDDFSVINRPIDYNTVNEKIRRGRSESLEILKKMLLE